jgi:hypothetical protein
MATSKESFSNNPSTSSASSGLSTISGVIGFLNGVFNAPKTPLPPLTTTELLGSLRFPGLSPIDITTKIISRKAEAGIDTGPLPNGEDNIDLKMERIRIEEIVKAIQTNAKVEVVILPGTVSFTGVGPTGPVKGVNDLPVKGYGVVR